MKTNLYSVNVEGFGVLLKSDDNIRKARAWARKAFPDRATAVSRKSTATKLCTYCGSRPCCCKETK